MVLADILPLFRVARSFVAEVATDPAIDDALRAEVESIELEVREAATTLARKLAPALPDPAVALADLDLATLDPAAVPLDLELRDRLAEAASTLHRLRMLADPLPGPAAATLGQEVDAVLQTDSQIRDFLMEASTAHGPTDRPAAIEPPVHLFVTRGEASPNHWSLMAGESATVGPAGCDVAYRALGEDGPICRVAATDGGARLVVEGGGTIEVAGRSVSSADIDRTEEIDIGPDIAFRIQVAGEAAGLSRPDPEEAPIVPGPCPGCNRAIVADDLASDRAFAADGGVYCLDCALAGAAPFEVVDEYIVLRPLGEGGMGDVYLVADHRTRSLAAMKALRGVGEGGSEAIVRFLSEFRTGGRLDHPNIIRYLDTGVARGLHYLIMEYRGGQTLRRVLLRNRRLEVEQAIRIAYQVTRALEHALERDVVHRDIKPENILIDRARTVRLLDFGLAKITSGSGRAGITRPGMVLGSLSYCAPEQIVDARAADHRADLYSLGVVLYEMLSGRRPIVAFSPEGMIERIRAGEFPPLSSVVDRELPPDLEALVARAMALRPEDRFQTPGELGQALRDLR